MKLITLTTDFGTQDWFVGTMKGVIAGIAPRAAVVDLTHAIPAGDIRAGAFALAASYRYFPRRTIHVVVVDPGVGSRRAALAVETADYFFVAPDNGVLSWALAGEKIKTVRRLENDKYFLRPVSQTFHGRDIFAPVAAHLSQGVPPARLGPAVREFRKLPWPEPKQSRQAITGEVIYIDRFGNAITNLAAELLAEFCGPDCRIKVHGKSIGGLRRFYQEAPSGKPVAVAGSTGFLEIAVNGGSAAERLKPQKCRLFALKAHKRPINTG